MWRGYFVVVLTLVAMGFGTLPTQAQTAWRFDLTDSDAVVVLTGELADGIGEDFARFVAAHPRIRAVQLNPKLGGSPLEAMMLAVTIAEQKLATYVSDACVAACTIAFAGSDRRYLESGAKLGYTNFGNDSGAILTEANWVKVYLHRFQPEFVARAVATAPIDLWFPKARELLASGAITGYVESPDFSAESAPPTALSLEEGLLTSATLRVFKAILPDEWKSVVADLTDGFDSGLTFRELRAVALQRASQYRKSFVPYAADEPVRAFFAAVLAEADVIATRDVNACAEYIGGQFSENLKAVSDLLPMQYRIDRQARMDDMMLSVDTARPIPDKDYRMRALEKVFIALGPDQVNQLEQLEASPDATRTCNVVRNLYRELLKLPEQESGAAIKSLYLDR